MKRTKLMIWMFVALAVSLVASAVGGGMALHAHPEWDAGAVYAITGAAAFGVLCIDHFRLSERTPLIAFGVDVELWTRVVVDKLFANNTFASKARDLSGEVLGGVVAHLPQAGANPAVTKNRSVFPAVAVRRTDTDLTFNLDEYTTDPTHITMTEAATIAYDKIASILRAHINSVQLSFYLDLMYYWSGVGAAQIVRTSGALDGNALAPGATGTRKILTIKDIQAVQQLFNEQDIPDEGRWALLPPKLESQLVLDPDLLKRFQLETDLKNGVVGGLFGFKFMRRSTVTVYDATGTPVKKAPGAATAVTDNLSGLFWHEDSVTRALGNIQLFARDNDPLYYGDVKSMLVRGGGRQFRGDGLGICSLVQTA